MVCTQERIIVGEPKAQSYETELQASSEAPLAYLLLSQLRTNNRTSIADDDKMDYLRRDESPRVAHVSCLKNINTVGGHETEVVCEDRCPEQTKPELVAIEKQEFERLIC